MERNMSYVKPLLFFSLLFSLNSFAVEKDKIVGTYEEVLNLPIDTVWAEIMDYKKTLPCLGFSNFSVIKQEGDSSTILKIELPKTNAKTINVKYSVNKTQKSIKTELLGNPDVEVITLVQLTSQGTKTKLNWTEEKKSHPKFVTTVKQGEKANRQALVRCLEEKKKVLIKK